MKFNPRCQLLLDLRKNLLLLGIPDSLFSRLAFQNRLVSILDHVLRSRRAELLSDDAPPLPIL